MEKKAGDVKQFPKTAKPSLEKGETLSKPKTGKIVRIIPMGVPFSPTQFKRILELSQGGPVTKYPNLKR